MTAAASLETRLPRQIRERLERGKQIMAEFNATNGNEPPIAAEVPPQGEAEPPTPPQAEPSAEPPNPNPNPSESDLQPYRDPALATDPRANDPSYWRHRVSVLQGKLAEERRLADAREAALREKVATLESEVRTLKASATQTAPVDLTTFLRPEQIEAVGEDQAAAIVQAAVQAASKRVDDSLAQQQAEAQARHAAEAERSQQARQRQFFDELDEAAPNWREINARQDWLTWLGQMDPRTGQLRQAALSTAEARGDAKAVAEVVNTFISTLTPRQPPAVTPPAGPGAPPASAPRGPQDKSQIPPTQEEIADYYKRLAINRGRGVSEAERAEFEKRLQLL